MTLEISDLRISIQGKQIVQMADLSCGPGEIVGLVGESGCGKSMTTMAVVGLAARLGATVTGSIRLDGLELVGLSEERMRAVRGRRIALIFQSPALAFNPVIRVGVLFTRALRLRPDEARQRAGAVLEELHVRSSVLKRYPSELSGGELQRVAIALALCLDAELLLADEPTSALDVTVQAELLGILRRLADTRALGVVLITHDIAVVAEVADRVAVMRAGVLVETAATERLLTSPEHEYTRQLIDACPRFVTI